MRYYAVVSILLTAPLLIAYGLLRPKPVERVLALLLACTGFYGIYNGLTIEANAAGAIHQVYGAVYVAGGVIVVGLAVVVEAVANISTVKKRTEEQVGGQQTDG